MTLHPNPLPHLERFDRLLFTGTQIVEQIQQQVIKADVIGFCLPFFRLLIKQMQTDFEELAALTQCLKNNLNNIKDCLPQETSHE
jgi:hypothetical protein